MPSQRCLVSVAQNSTNEIQSRINHALKESPHCLGTQVIGTHDQGIVVLQGCVETFYHKQVAQELLRKLDGVQRIVNLLEVHWNDSIRLNDNVD
jgi:osmotically-inducible protein OsmY